MSRVIARSLARSIGVGITKGCLYGHFPDKEALRTAACEEARRDPEGDGFQESAGDPGSERIKGATRSNFRRSFRIEHDGAFRKILLERAGEEFIFMSTSGVRTSGSSALGTVM
jgi:AcrR family transcriptional regulator